jgi:hypothetical protein
VKWVTAGGLNTGVPTSANKAVGDEVTREEIIARRTETTDDRIRLRRHMLFGLGCRGS